jgi:poly(A) polymerase
MTDREFAISVCRGLREAGFRALFAGGCVRDELLGRVPADYDIATDATPDQVKPLFRRCLLVGAAFGVVEVLGPRGVAGEWLKVQVATFRSDGTYSDGRRPDRVVYSSPREDAERRDFTVNALFADPFTNEIIDYVDGRADLEKGILRAVGDPSRRFEEDKLRLLRAVRMAARFDLTVDPGTLLAAQKMAAGIAVVSAERIGEEFRKILLHPSRARGLELLSEFGLRAIVLPEIQDDWALIIQRIRVLPPAVTFATAFAIVLAELNVKTVAAVARRFRLSNEDAQRTAWLVEQQPVLRNVQSLPNSKLYPVLAHPGAAELLELQRAFGRGAVAEYCDALREQGTDFNPAALVTGTDLTAAGEKPGPAFKAALDAARSAQLDGSLQTTEDARTFALDRIEATRKK